jgi:hypothetical protein
MSMVEAGLTALLSSLLEEVCADIPQAETATRQRVASKIFEAAQKGQCSIEDLRRAGRDALKSAPTMWR